MMTPPATLQPRDERDICDAVANAAAGGRKLEIVGGGSKRGIGNPERKTSLLSTAGLARIVDYDPAELVLTVEPSARLSDIEKLLAEQNQMLAFEPYDFAGVAGGESGCSTIGGVIGAGLAGSRRLSAGGVRDHLLGFRAVNGRGEAFKAGGKVVKNVTGYDLSKLMAGSWGQLAVLTEITLKVLPKPAVAATMVLRGLAPATAVSAMASAMRSQAEVAAASYTPERDSGPSLTAVRVEGFGPSVEVRVQMLVALLSDVGPVEKLEAAEAEPYWRGVRDATLLGDNGARPVLSRICVPPSRGAAVLSGLIALDGVALLDWAGGLVWARTPASLASTSVRQLAEEMGGHAMLADAPDDVRRATSALHPEAAGVAALSRKVREAFDPAGVFDPLRFGSA